MPFLNCRVIIICGLRTIQNHLLVQRLTRCFGLEIMGFIMDPLSDRTLRITELHSLCSPARWDSRLGITVVVSLESIASLSLQMIQSQ